jgi:hypothetical protein
MTIGQYRMYFINAIAVLESIGGNIWHHPGMRKGAIHRLHTANEITNTEWDGLDDDEKTLVEATIKGEYLATRFMMGADMDRFGRMIMDLADDYAKGKDKYPKTLEEAVSRLKEWSYNNPYRNQ